MAQDSSVAPCSPSCPAEPDFAVLDTNVVLDWLVFANRDVALLQRAVLDGKLVWLSCPAIRAELARMLGHASLSGWRPDAAAALATHDRLAKLRPDPGPLGADAPRCSDPDDQLFVDLAITSSARWLLSRDKALLKLGRRLRPRRIEVLTPLAWSAARGAATRASE